MKKILISLTLAAGLLAFPADAQKAAMGPKAGISAVSGVSLSSIEAPIGCAATNVLFFGTPVTVGPKCDTRLTYDPTTGRFVVGPGNLLVVDPSFGVSIPALRIGSLYSGAVPVIGASGLVEAYSELKYTEPVSGVEEIVNGTFTGNADGWTLGAGWTYGTNYVAHTEDGTATLMSSGIVTNIGEMLKLSFTITAATTGTFRVISSGARTREVTATNGTYEMYFMAFSTSTSISFYPSSTARFRVDNVSLKRVTSLGGLRASSAISASALRILGLSLSPDLPENALRVTAAWDGLRTNVSLRDDAGVDNVNLSFQNLSLSGNLDAATGTTTLATTYLRIPVEINSAGSGSPNIIGLNETNKTFGNSGTAKNYHTLPSAFAGYIFTFVVLDTDGMRITAAAGDTIRIAGTVSAAAGYIEAATIGNTVTLVALDATQWVATSVIGTWTFGP